MGLNVPAPDCSTLSRRQAGLEVDLPVKPTGQPIHLVVDSTGLKVYGESEWKVRQHGWTQRRTWRRLPPGLSADTGDLAVATLTVVGGAYVRKGTTLVPDARPGGPVRSSEWGTARWYCLAA